MALRFCTGFAVGGNLPLVITLASEFLPPKIRDKSVIGLHLAYEAGELTATGLAALLLPKSWRLYMLILAVPAVVTALIATLRLPESPHWLLEQGRGVEAAALLTEALRRREDTGSCLAWLANPCGRRHTDTAGSLGSINSERPDVEREHWRERERGEGAEGHSEPRIEYDYGNGAEGRDQGGEAMLMQRYLAVIRAVESKDQSPGSKIGGREDESGASSGWAILKRLCRPEVRVTTVCLSITWYMMNVASGWWTWAPIIAERDGISDQAMYATATVARIVAIVSFLLAMGLVSCCCSTWTVLLINVLGASCISGLMMLVLQPGVTVAFFAILYCTFALFFGGTWPILYVVTPQAFPTISRGAGFGLASAFSKLGAISLPIFVGLLLDRSRLALGTSNAAPFLFLCVGEWFR